LDFSSRLILFDMNFLFVVGSIEITIFYVKVILAEREIIKIQNRRHT